MRIGGFVDGLGPNDGLDEKRRSGQFDELAAKGVSGRGPADTALEPTAPLAAERRGSARTLARRRRDRSEAEPEERYNHPMSIDELEAEALKLEPTKRARLAEKLLASLEDLSEEENARLWAEEAARRDAEWDRTTAMGRPAEDVFRDARARLK